MDGAGGGGAEDLAGVTPRSKRRVKKQTTSSDPDPLDLPPPEPAPDPPISPLAMEPDADMRTAVTDVLAANQQLRKALGQKDAETNSLKHEVLRLREELQSSEAQSNQKAEELLALRAELETTKATRRRRSTVGPRRKHHPLSAEANMVDPMSGTVRRGHMGRQASIATSSVLEQLPQHQRDMLALKFLDMYKDPVKYAAYLASEEFAQDIIKLCDKAKPVYEGESRCLFLESPCYVFGDTHGNLEDLHFFSDNIWRLGLNLCAGRFLFLGDYVDRGMSSLEVVTYLIALKLLYPEKVFMLRGNHETRDVNGWEEHYEERSFLRQCKDRFGTAVGEQVWEELNQVFDRLPLAAIIDKELFCIHGGIPRPIPGSPPGASRIEMLQRISPVSGINPPYEHEDEDTRQMASECIWSDPAGEDQEESGELGPDGFGESPRGGGTVCFGNKAIDDFLQQHQLSYIIRAHEAHAYGVSLSKRARCFTVFSTSKDHNQGREAICGCILVDFEKMEVITRSSHYKNHYVHRRDSMSIASLPSHELAAREKVGLVVEEELSSDEYEEYEEEELDYDGAEMET